MRFKNPCQPHVSSGRDSVIIQERVHDYRFITQHDHGRLSGELAAAWRDPETGKEISEELLIATYLHDVLWVQMDRVPSFDFESGKPLDFLAYPEAEKLEQYELGIDLITSVDPYTALLHALHFSEFVNREKHPAFRQRMDMRIAHLRASLGEARCENVDSDLQKLRFFDVLSLLLCMTGPGIPRTPPPWLNPSPHLTKRGLSAWWEGDDFILDPYRFNETLQVWIPYRDIPMSHDPEALRTAFLSTPVAHQAVTIRAASPSERAARAKK